MTQTLKLPTRSMEAKFCPYWSDMEGSQDVTLSNILTLHDVPNIWHIPLLLKDQKAHEAILKALNLLGLVIQILWRGNGIDQLSYIRGESRFSDHRPVCAVFSVDVEGRSRNNRFRKGY